MTLKQKSYLITFWVLWLLVFWLISYNYASYRVERNKTEEIIENTQTIKKAYFAAGCFWCAESSFEHYKDDGVLDVVSWYAGWDVENPTYQQVGLGTTWHRESIEVLYDPERISYEDLLQIFWRTANPTDPDGQYVDRWFSYTSAIFYQTVQEKEIAENSKKTLAESGRFENEKIVTPIIEYMNFYPAEDYHQDFYIKSPIRYNGYTNNSGRKEFLKGAWWDDLKYDVK